MTTKNTAALSKTNPGGALALALSGAELATLCALDGIAAPALAPETYPRVQVDRKARGPARFWTPVPLPGWAEAGRGDGDEVGYISETLDVVAVLGRRSRWEATDKAGRLVSFSERWAQGYKGRTQALLALALGDGSLGVVQVTAGGLAAKGLDALLSRWRAERAAALRVAGGAPQAWPFIGGVIRCGESKDLPIPNGAGTFRHATFGAAPDLASPRLDAVELARDMGLAIDAWQACDGWPTSGLAGVDAGHVESDDE